MLFFCLFAKVTIKTGHKSTVHKVHKILEGVGGENLMLVRQALKALSHGPTDWNTRKDTRFVAMDSLRVL